MTGQKGADAPAQGHTGGESSSLAVHNVTVRFGGLVALDNVSMSVFPGQIVGVIGPNGAGKTTLFNVMCGFVLPQSGYVTRYGVRLRPRPHHLHRLGIARTLQNVGLFSGLTVLENVMTAARPTIRAGFVSALLALPRADRSERELRERAYRLLAELGVAEYADLLPGTLPFAVQKRVALARALVANPQLLLLDEPAGGLAGDEIDTLAKLIRSLPRRLGGRGSVVVVEHHMDLVMSVCDEIVVLDFGRVIAKGTPDQVRANPAVVEAYLGNAPANTLKSTPERLGTGEVAP